MTRRDDMQRVLDQVWCAAVDATTSDDFTGDEAARERYRAAALDAAIDDLGRLILPVIPNPARLTPGFEAALRRRYAATAAGGDVVARYGAACDLVVQLFWADRYGTDPEDPLLHTSDQARTVAALFCEVLGIDLAAAVRALDAEDEAR